MRLRNRMVKASTWTDGELCRWSRDKREFYRSLWAMAEDSCCIEDDPFGWKLCAWPSPLDSDMTEERFTEWRDELIAERKLIAYESGGDRLFYIPAMAKHEQMRNPQRPDLPLPPWVRWVQNGSDQRKGKYEHDTELLQGSYNGCTTVPAQPRPVPPSPDPSGAAYEDRTDTPPPPRSNFPRCFAEEIERDGKTLSFRGHLLRDLERYAGTWPSIPKNQGKLGAAITEGCPPDCQGDKARRCASQLIVHAKTLHEEFTAKSEPFPVELFLYKCREGAR